MSIKFIYFDLGNVLVQVDQVKAGEQLKIWLNKININSQNTNSKISLIDLYKIVNESSNKSDWDLGQIDKNQYMGNILDQLSPSQRNSKQLIKQGIKILCDNSFRPMTLEGQLNAAIQQIKHNNPQIKIGILSNTCDAHWSYISDKFPIVKDTQWDQIILSYQHGCAKPDNQIFQIAHQATKVNKDQVLFIDDLDQNVEAARQFGWHSHTALSGLDIMHYLATYGLID